jgi:phosphatidylglycerophosphate synthase
MPEGTSPLETGGGAPDRFNYQVSLKKDRQGFFARYLALERWINRPLAGLVVRAVYPTRMTPNQLTVISFAFSLVTALLFAYGTPLACLWGALLVQLSLVFDCADGMLARARNQGSRYGAHLDLFLDRISDFIVVLGATVGYFRQSGSWPMLSLGLLAIALYMLQVNLFYVHNQYRNSKSGESGEARALGIYAVTLCAIIYRLDWIIIAILAESLLNLVYRITHFLRDGPADEG